MIMPKTQSNLRERGKEALTDLIYVTDNDLEFIGRVHTLEKNPIVDEIRHYTGHVHPLFYRGFKIILKNGTEMSSKETLRWLAAHGFPDPRHINEDSREFCAEYRPGNWSFWVRVEKEYEWKTSSSQ